MNTNGRNMKIIIFEKRRTKILKMLICLPVGNLLQVLRRKVIKISIMRVAARRDGRLSPIARV